MNGYILFVLWQCDVRAVANCPSHYLYQIRDIKGKTQYIHVINCHKVESLHYSHGTHYHLQLLSLVVLGAIKDIK